MVVSQEQCGGYRSTTYLDQRSRPETSSLLAAGILRTRTGVRDLNTVRGCRRKSLAVLPTLRGSAAGGKSHETSSTSRGLLARSC